MQYAQASLHYSPDESLPTSQTDGRADAEGRRLNLGGAPPTLSPANRPTLRYAASQFSSRRSSADTARTRALYPPIVPFALSPCPYLLCLVTRRGETERKPSGNDTSMNDCKRPALQFLIHFGCSRAATLDAPIDTTTSTHFRRKIASSPDSRIQHTL